MELIGSDILTARLLALPQKLRTSIEKKALHEANNLILDKLRFAVPSDTGALQSSLRHNIRTYHGGGLLIGRIGADMGFSKPIPSKKQTGKRGTKPNKKQIRRPAKYLHLVNLGTVKRQTQSGANRGSVPATHFREKTITELKPQIEQIFNNAVQEALQSGS